jgi:hypothetical protein
MDYAKQGSIDLLNVERIARSIYKLVVGHVTKHTVEVSGTGQAKHKAAISQGSLSYIYPWGALYFETSGTAL